MLPLPYARSGHGPIERSLNAGMFPFPFLPPGLAGFGAGFGDLFDKQELVARARRARRDQERQARDAGQAFYLRTTTAGVCSCRTSARLLKASALDCCTPHGCLFLLTVKRSARSDLILQHLSDPRSAVASSAQLPGLRQMPMRQLQPDTMDAAFRPHLRAYHQGKARCWRLPACVAGSLAQPLLSRRLVAGI